MMTTSTLTLADWLLAQAVDDRARSVHALEGYRSGQTAYRAHHERIIRDCDALVQVVSLFDGFPQTDSDGTILAIRMVRDAVLRTLAWRYADRPGYDEESRP